MLLEACLDHCGEGGLVHDSRDRGTAGWGDIDWPGWQCTACSNSDSKGRPWAPDSSHGKFHTLFPALVLEHSSQLGQQAL